MSFTVTVTGNVGREPEVSTLPDGRLMARCGLAHTPRTQDAGGAWVDAGPTVWVDVVAFGSMADWLGVVPRGARLTVSGRAQRRDFVRKDGQPDHALRVVVDMLGLHDRRQQPQQPVQSQQAPAAVWTQQPQQAQQQQQPVQSQQPQQQAAAGWQDAQVLPW